MSRIEIPSNPDKVNFLSQEELQRQNSLNQGVPPLPPGFQLEQSQSNVPALPPGFVLENNTPPLPPGFQLEDGENELVAGKYKKEDLATKMIPQFTKGLYDSDIRLLAPGLENKPSALDPSQTIGEIQSQIPDAKGFLPNVARITGEVAPYMAMSAPFTGAASAATKIPKALRLATGTGAYEGAKNIAQGKFKEAPKEAMKGALWAQGGQTGAKVFGAVVKSAGKILKNTPARIINSMVKPLLKDFSYGKNPGRGVAKEGIVANSFDELAQKLSARTNELGGQIRKHLDKFSDKRVDLSKALNPIDDALAKARKAPNTNSALITRLENVKRDLIEESYDEFGNAVAGRNLVDLTPSEAAQFKQLVGDLTKWTGNASDDQLVNKALKQVYGQVKGRINAKVPSVAGLNERYADLKTAEIATKYRDKITERQNLLSFSGKILGGGQMAGGAATGNLPMILNGLATFGVDKVMGSPAAKTRLAKVLAKLPAPELEIIIQKYPQLAKLPQVSGRIAGFVGTRQNA